MPRRLSAPLADIAPRYDAVIVGSGYGGAIAAYRLAQRGHSVCLLERGREIWPGAYPDGLLSALGDVQLDTPERHLFSHTGMFDFRLDRDINVLVGCGLGGTSLINANVALWPKDWVLDDARWPRALCNDRDSLLKGRAMAEAVLGPNEIPAAQALALPKHLALRRIGDVLGCAHELARINVSFREDTRHAACRLCGDCVTGCNYDAKRTVLNTYIAWFAAFDRARIFTEASVRHLQRTGNEWTVWFDLAGVAPDTGPRLRVRAPRVVLAAGTLGSTEILLRSCDAARGNDRLRLSPLLGKRFSANGDTIAVAYDCESPVDAVGAGERRPDLRSPVGPCITATLAVPGNGTQEDEFIVQDASVPGALHRVLPVLLGGAAACWGRPMSAVGAGTIAQELTRWTRYLRGAYHGATRRTQLFLVVGHDSADGELTLQDDRLRIHWPDASRLVLPPHVERALLRATGVLGGTFIPNPFRPITVHPLGGCVMGENPDSGVVDDLGRVFRTDARAGAVYDGLVVCDGSMVPRSLGVNPLLTISALAERAWTHLP